MIEKFVVEVQYRKNVSRYALVCRRSKSVFGVVPNAVSLDVGQQRIASIEVHGGLTQEPLGLPWTQAQSQPKAYPSGYSFFNG